MASVSEHFSQDFSKHKTETLPSPTTVTIVQSARDIQVNVQFHHDQKLRKSFMSVLRPGDLGANEITSFYQTSLPQLRDRCIQESTVTSHPKTEPSTDVYVYTETTHEEGIQQVGQLRIIRRGPNYADRMHNLTNLINEFANQYQEHERERYRKAAQHARALVEAALKERKILAIVSHREKDPTRLKDKLWQRAIPLEEPEAAYLQQNDIINDLIDLAGVRVALYFPGDRDRTVEALAVLLPTQKTAKTFPEGQRKKIREMRFAGYRATHLRLRVPGAAIEEDAARSFPVEIQIASLIMHAWSEVEHDLDYKQLDGTVSDLELELLDQLNGLALAGEISLEQLQTARNDRIRKQQLAQNL